MDRITLSAGGSVEPYDGADYLENNCAEEPSKLCEFKRISGKILKTVDSVYQDINTIDECRDLCLNSFGSLENAGHSARHADANRLLGGLPK